MTPIGFRLQAPARSCTVRCNVEIANPAHKFHHEFDPPDQIVTRCTLAPKAVRVPSRFWSCFEILNRSSCLRAVLSHYRASLIHAAAGRDLHKSKPGDEIANPVHKFHHEFDLLGQIVDGGPLAPRAAAHAPPISRTTSNYQIDLRSTLRKLAGAALVAQRKSTRVSAVRVS